jgi:uncharacterized protein (DUF302 family)
MVVAAFIPGAMVTLERKTKMSAQQPQHSKYGFSKTVDFPYEEAVAKTTAALKDEGFGVLCEIDIRRN